MPFVLTQDLTIFEGEWDSNGQDFSMYGYRGFIPKNHIITTFPDKETCEKLKKYIIATMPKKEEK